MTPDELTGETTKPPAATGRAGAVCNSPLPRRRNIPRRPSSAGRAPATLRGAIVVPPLRPLIRQSHTGAAAPPAAIRSAFCAVDRRFTTVSVREVSTAPAPPRRRPSRRAPHPAKRPPGRGAAPARRSRGAPPAGRRHGRARPIISMLSRWVPPTTCSRPVSPRSLTRTHTGLSQPCSARTAGSSGSPSWAAASAYRLARTMMRSPQPRRTQYLP